MTSKLCAMLGYILTLTSNIDAIALHNTSSTSQYSRATSLPLPLRVGAFNIKTFGRTKMSDPFLARVIRDIVLRYDLILIQEIRDSTGTALSQLHEMVGRNTYGLTVSERLGRTTYKEEYAYFYKNERLTLQAVHQYSDPGDIFEREPYSARFKAEGTNWEFSVVGFHAKPSDAVAEIEALIDVYDDIRRVWPSSDDVLIMGDLNAACSYASVSDLQPLPIYNEDLFYWPLGFNVDTTTGSSVCAYDRFIVAGSTIRQGLIPGSEDIFRYELAFDLTEDEMLDVSDHYPIELEIYF